MKGEVKLLCTVFSVSALVPNNKFLEGFP